MLQKRDKVPNFNNTNFLVYQFILIKNYFSEIEFCEALKTSETRAKEFEADSVKLQKEITELTLELTNSRKPGETDQEVQKTSELTF